jgi:5-methylcytosine-specific restriction endonuclease McrA
MDSTPNCQPTVSSRQIDNYPVCPLGNPLQEDGSIAVVVAARQNPRGPFKTSNAERDRNKRYRDSHKEKIKAYKKSYFIKNKDRHRVYSAKRRLMNPEQVKKEDKSRYDKNPGRNNVYKHNRRANIKNCVGKISKGITERLYLLQKGKCPVCKISFKNTVYHLDHIIPLSRGGKNVDGNVQLLCKTCNLRKNAKDPIVFMQENGYLL